MVRRARMIIAATAVAALALAGCSADPKPSKTFPKRPTTGLAAKLEPAPKFSGPGSSSWARDYTPSTEQFLEQFYGQKVRGTIRGDLRQQGLQEIAHALWITDDNIQNDVVVLRFDTSSGANDRLQFVQRTNNGNGELRTYQISGMFPAIVYYTDRPVNRGFLQANAYAQVGTYVVEMFTYAARSIPRVEISRWVTAQQRLLTT